jgi:putative transposon-encoded protein
MKGELVFKTPSVCGNGAVVFVPKRWIGWTIRCEVVRKKKKD